MRRLMASGGQGYLSVQCSSTTSSFPARRQTSRASSTSARVEVPVERSMGLPTRAARSMRPWQVRSAEAILKAGTSREARKSTASSSKGVENAVSPTWRAWPSRDLKSRSESLSSLSKVSHCVPLGSAGSTQ